MEVVAELGRDHPVVSVPLDRLADERLGLVVAVALGGVNQVDAEVSCAPSSWSTSGWVKRHPHSPPSCQVPIPTTETRRPVLPNLRYFMLATFLARSRGQAWHRPDTPLLRPCSILCRVTRSGTTAAAGTTAPPRRTRGSRPWNQATLMRSAGEVSAGSRRRATDRVARVARRPARQARRPPPGRTGCQPSGAARPLPAGWCAGGRRRVARSWR
jgi:hypothetical protein